MGYFLNVSYKLRVVTIKERDLYSKNFVLSI